MSENAVLERGEWMFHGRSSQPHGRRCRALLHALQRTIVYVTLYQPSRGVGASRFQRTLAAGLRSRRVEHALLTGQHLFACQSLVGRAAESIGLFVVFKLGSVKQSAISMAVDRTIGGHMRHDALGFADLGLLAVGVTSIRHYVQRVGIADRLLGGLRHVPQTPI